MFTSSNKKFAKCPLENSNHHYSIVQIQVLGSEIFFLIIYPCKIAVTVIASWGNTTCTTYRHRYGYGFHRLGLIFTAWHSLNFYACIVRSFLVSLNLSLRIVHCCHPSLILLLVVRASLNNTSEFALFTYLELPYIGGLVKDLSAYQLSRNGQTLPAAEPFVDMDDVLQMLSGSSRIFISLLKHVDYTQWSTIRYNVRTEPIKLYLTFLVTIRLEYHSVLRCFPDVNDLYTTK